jgi:acetylcholinesterase
VLSGISGGGVEVEGPERQQGLFDNMVKFVGYDGAANKIQCLRDAPYEKIYQHAQTVNYFLGYRSLASAWTLRPDGKFLTESPDKLVAEGKIANVPIIYGDMRDEAALFSLINTLNPSTADEIIDYFKTYWCLKATEEQLQKIMEIYPDNPADGSPFGTGLLQLGPIIRTAGRLSTARIWCGCYHG